MNIDYNKEPAINVAFGGTVVALNTPGHKDEPKGFLLDAYGMFTCGRVMAAMGLPCGGPPNIMYGYGTGSDGKSLLAYEVRQAGNCCCANFSLFKQGQGIPDEGAFLARTKLPFQGCCGFCKTAVTYAIEKDKGEVVNRLYSLKNHPRGAMDCYAWCLPCSHCSKGILQGNVCVNVRTPIWKGESAPGEADYDLTDMIGMYTKTAIMYPTGCCVAAIGPAVNVRVDLTPEYEATLSEDEKAVLLLLVATQNGTVDPTAGGAAIPVFGGQFCLGAGVQTLGWTLGIPFNNTTYDYQGLMDSFARGAANTGDMVARAKSLATGK